MAYGSLLQERRRVLDAGIVEALKMLAGERLAEQVEDQLREVVRSAQEAQAAPRQRPPPLAGEADRARHRRVVHTRAALEVELHFHHG